MADSASSLSKIDFTTQIGIIGFCEKFRRAFMNFTILQKKMYLPLPVNLVPNHVDYNIEANKNQNILSEK